MFVAIRCFLSTGRPRRERQTAGNVGARCPRMRPAAATSGSGGNVGTCGSPTTSPPEFARPCCSNSPASSEGSGSGRLSATRPRGRACRPPFEAGARPSVPGPSRHAERSDPETCPTGQRATPSQPTRELPHRNRVLRPHPSGMPTESARGPTGKRLHDVRAHVADLLRRERAAERRHVVVPR